MGRSRDLAPAWALQLDDVGGLGALLALGDIEADPLVFEQGAEPPILDGGVMDEQVSAATIGGDEAETLFGVEPFDGALCCHDFTLP